MKKQRSKKVLFLLISIILTSCIVITPSANEVRRVYSKNSNKIGQVALTFDDGPHPRYTRDILNILEEYHITATFFVIGVNAT